MPRYTNDEMLKFQKEIEDKIWQKDISYLEAILEFCTEQDFEIENVPSIISANVRFEIEREAEELSLLKEKKSRLPF